MRTWRDQTANVVSGLRLDPYNVRQEGFEGAPEVDIIRDLFANAKVLSLVESIAKVGYLTNEIPVVVRRDNRLVVVEGNRRVAALKAIQNPNLVPAYQARVSRLVQLIPDRQSLERIRVKRAPNQDEANQLIAALHTGDIRLRWKPLRQAAFLEAQVDAGKNLDDLLAQYPTTDVRRLAFAAGISGLFKRANYGDPGLIDFVNSADLDATTLARIYESADFIRLTGAKLTPDARVTLGISDGAFSDIAEHIIAGMVSRALTSRTLPTIESERFKQLIIDLTSMVPPDERPSAMLANSNDDDHQATGRDPSSPGRSSSGDPRAETSDDVTEPPQPDAARPAESPKGGAGKAERTRLNRLGADHLVSPKKFPPAIGKILSELQTINVRTYPNATMDLLRSFLEKCIKAYAETTNETISASPGRPVQLHHCLQWLEGHFRQSQQRGLAQVAKKLQSGKVSEYLASVEHLNAINHNPHIYASPDQVMEVWNTMDSVLRALLNED